MAGAEAVEDCLHITVIFQPNPEQAEDYQVYGKGRREAGDSGPVWFQANLGDETLNLMPVRGVGLSRRAWQDDVEHAGWRYAGYLGFQKNKTSFRRI